MADRGRTGAFSGRHPDKRRRWLLAVGVLLDQTGVLGDIIVITARRSVARWARKVAHIVTELGTRLSLTPVVFHLGPANVKLLLDEQRPELALFAAWAMHHRHGPKARDVVEQAIKVTERLPEPLRGAQMRAILGVLSARMLAVLKENEMDLSKIPQRPAVRKFLEAFGYAEGEAQGKAAGEAQGSRNALLAVLEARGLGVSAEERAAVEACTDLAQLDRWVRRAATAGSTREVLAVAPEAPAPAPRRRNRAKAARSR